MPYFCVVCGEDAVFRQVLKPAFFPPGHFGGESGISQPVCDECHAGLEDWQLCSIEQILENNREFERQVMEAYAQSRYPLPLQVNIWEDILDGMWNGLCYINQDGHAWQHDVVAGALSEPALTVRC